MHKTATDDQLTRQQPTTTPEVTSMKEDNSSQSIHIPICNVYAKGDYCAQLLIGSEQTPVNLILDTGSSTLVVEQKVYQPQTDQELQPTSFAQEVNYGIGGWDGPVVTTSVSIGNQQDQLTLKQTPLALVSCDLQNKTFGEADGMFGLAYRHLNKSYDLKDYLQQNNITPAVTYPWPFSHDEKAHQQATVHNVNIAAAKASSLSQQPDEINSDDLRQFNRFLWQSPKKNIIPYFTSLEEHDLIANKFAFYSKRSSIYVADDNATTAELAQHPLNQGALILGGGEEQSQLYRGEFTTLEVEHDIYYNVSLSSVQVGNQPAIPAPPLAAKHQKSYFTNAIIDTGASLVVLTSGMYQQMLKDFTAISAGFTALLAPFEEISAQETGIDSSLLDLDKWPDLTFNFTGSDNKTVSLVCKPETYWQTNSPKADKACFKILTQLPNWPNQSILGLPLLNNYYLIFDRTVNGTGVIKCASPC
ncbi:pepsin-like aspartic protease [Thalassomonas actiniarum]|uniref:A1 family peptidase n=1 Tax=Thalassomonas actiniarum TaxID=485447 RepID=A0AAE9YV56_9GAMM|nr:pepsin-like aspartic protease [Thalassomonas actiniarum]WDE01162.1 A1 family peptidase [Thalassomonas actiniarum]